MKKEKLDVSKYKEENIDNIFKEETPIVKQLQYEQSKYFIIGFLAFIAFFAFGYMSDHSSVPQSIILIVGIILAIIFIFTAVKSVQISRTKDKIMKWQRDTLYAKYRKDE